MSGTLIHAYEILPQRLILRRSGPSNEVVPCHIVRTRVTLTETCVRNEENVYKVFIPIITSGYEHLYFEQWFSDWSVADLWDPVRNQPGRPIDVAIPSAALDQLLQKPNRHFSQEPCMSENVHKLMRAHDYDSVLQLADYYQPFSQPVAAVLIDGFWVEPLRTYDARTRLSSTLEA